MCYFIGFANTLVFLAWKIPVWRPVMLKYFATNPASSELNYYEFLHYLVIITDK